MKRTALLLTPFSNFGVTDWSRLLTSGADRMCDGMVCRSVRWWWSVIGDGLQVMARVTDIGWCWSVCAPVHCLPPRFSARVMWINLILLSVEDLRPECDINITLFVSFSPLFDDIWRIFAIKSPFIWLNSKKDLFVNYFGHTLSQIRRTTGHRVSADAMSDSEP